MEQIKKTDKTYSASYREVEKDMESGKELISVIVPVYNIEDYIERCIESIQNQSYRQLEIILVDDGSCDRSGDICDQYARMDQRISVIHKQNGGLSSARNAGLNRAVGEFISLIDGDDYIHPQMYEKMLTVLQKEKADMISCGFQMVEEQDIESVLDISESHMQTDYICVTGNEIFQQLWVRDNETVVQWNKLFRRELFENCRYPEGKYHEDVYVIHRLLAKCKTVIYLDDKLYYYIQRQGSIMHLETSQMIEDAVEGYEQRIAFFKERSLRYEYGKTLRVLFDYFTWKYEIIKERGSEEEKRWLVGLYQKKYSKYERDIAHEIGERILYRLPQYYDAYLSWISFQRKFSNALSRRINKLLRK